MSRIDATKVTNSEKSAHFNTLLSSALQGNRNTSNATQLWKNLKTVTHNAAVEAFGRKKGLQDNDWYSSNSDRLDPLIAAKRDALQAYKDSPSTANHQRLKTARSKVQEIVRICINDYRLNLSNSVQQASDTGNIGRCTIV